MPIQRYTEQKEAITIGDQVSPSSTSTQEFLFDGDGELSGELQIRFYEGSELSLHVTPYIVRRNGVKIPIINFAGTKGYIDGNDDNYVFDVNIPVYTKDKLVVVAENTNASYSYDYRMNATYNRGVV